MDARSSGDRAVRPWPRRGQCLHQRDGRVRPAVPVRRGEEVRLRPRAGRGWNSGIRERENGENPVERWNGGTVERWNGGTLKAHPDGSVAFEVPLYRSTALPL